MYPEQNSPQGAEPGPTNQYDFILNPPPAPKRNIFSRLGVEDSFAKRLILIIGAGFVGLMSLWLVAIIFGGGNSNVDDGVSLVQTEQEIVRVAELGEDATDQEVRNSAINIKLSITTQQLEWISFLQGHGREVGDEELNLKLDAETDTRFESAKQANTFDRAFLQTMESLLRDYMTELDTAFNRTENTTQRDLLSQHYLYTEVLIKQLPS